jgi:hypothetical protein
VSSSGGERPSPPALSQQGGGAGGSPTRVVPGRVASGPDKAEACQHCQMARARRAGRKGVRKEPAFTPLNGWTGSKTWWIWAGSGAHPSPEVVWGWGTLGLAFNDWPGDHGEVLRGSRGDAAGAESGSSFVERTTVNTGTTWSQFPSGRQPAARAG